MASFHLAMRSAKQAADRTQQDYVVRRARNGQWMNERRLYWQDPKLAFECRGNGWYLVQPGGVSTFMGPEQKP